MHRAAPAQAPLLEEPLTRLNNLYFRVCGPIDRRNGWTIELPPFTAQVEIVVADSSISGLNSNGVLEVRLADAEPALSAGPREGMWIFENYAGEKIGTLVLYRLPEFKFKDGMKIGEDLVRLSLTESTLKAERASPYPDRLLNSLNGDRPEQLVWIEADSGKESPRRFDLVSAVFRDPHFSRRYALTLIIENDSKFRRSAFQRFLYTAQQFEMPKKES